MDYKDIYDIGFEAIRGYWSHKERFDFFTNDTYLNLATQNMLVYLGSIPYKSWKVVAVGIHLIEATTANQAPVIHFGDITDNDSIGIMTTTATASKLIGQYSWLETHAPGYDNILPTDIRTGETAAQAVVTWSEAGTGSIFNVEQTAPKMLLMKAITGGISSGKVFVCFVIENLTEREYR